MICLCLFQNFLSVRELNFLLIFLLFLMICSLHKWYCPIGLKGIGWISIKFCFVPLSIIEISGGDNSTSLCTCVFYFLCYIFPCYILRDLLKSLHSLKHIFLLYVWKISGQTLKKIVFSELRNLVLICYLVICLCLFQNYLSVRKLNCLLLFLLILLISNIYVVLG